MSDRSKTVGMGGPARPWDDSQKTVIDGGGQPQGGQGWPAQQPTVTDDGFQPTYPEQRPTPPYGVPAPSPGGQPPAYGGWGQPQPPPGQPPAYGSWGQQTPPAPAQQPYGGWQQPPPQPQPQQQQPPQPGRVDGGAKTVMMTAAPPPENIPLAWMAVAEGIGGRRGQVFQLGVDTVVGRATAQIPLNDPSVSTRHLKIHLEPSEQDPNQRVFVLYDQGSTNGTFAGDYAGCKQALPQNRVYRFILKDGDYVLVGQTLLVFKQV